MNNHILNAPNQFDGVGYTAPFKVNPSRFTRYYENRVMPPLICAKILLQGSENINIQLEPINDITEGSVMK
ncbi:hypothetical protein Thermo_00368 [Thermoplasmatales archaeon]|nr:hypothetical protein Thermo_00368 [Thermoplasmatales archaeon]